VKHRFHSKVATRAVNGRATELVFRCKRCGVSVKMSMLTPEKGRSPYRECEKLGIPRDCNLSIAEQVMES
jgi:hypothetical protein